MWWKDYLEEKWRCAYRPYGSTKWKKPWKLYFITIELKQFIGNSMQSINNIWHTRLVHANIVAVIHILPAPYFSKHAGVHQKRASDKTCLQTKADKQTVLVQLVENCNILTVFVDICGPFKQDKYCDWHLFCGQETHTAEIRERTTLQKSWWDTYALWITQIMGRR